MKLVSFIFGILLFSIITTIMFSGVQNYLTENQLKDPAEFKQLAGDYEQFIDDTTLKSNSTGLLIREQVETGVASSEERDVDIISGAISGGKLTLNFFTNFDDVVNKVRGDTGRGQDLINPKIFDVVIALAAVFLILVVLHFARGFKTET